MKWSILILHQPCRVKFLERLMGVLQPQLAAFPDVEIVVRECNRFEEIGKNRQAMIEESTGEYISFIDDDDCVATDYVEQIRPLMDGVDYVGFQVGVYSDGQLLGPDSHSLKHGGWFTDGGGFHCDISHVNPIRRDLALRATFTGCGNEDARWANSLRDLKIVKTEHYIPKDMYLYYIRSNKTGDEPGKFGVNS